MGPFLTQADSFNSSGATIVPDDRDNGLQYPTRSRLSAGNGETQNLPPFVAQARLLMPNDTLGHELEEMTAKSNGNLGDDGSVNGQNWSFVSNIDQADQSAASNSQSTQPIPLSFSALLNIPSSPPSQVGQSFQPELDQQNGDINSQFELQFPPSNHFGNFDNFRPSSAQSHNTNHSEYSFSSTDIDSDSVMSESNPQLQARNLHLGVDLGALDMSAGQPGHGQNYWNPQLGQDTQSSNGRTLMPDFTSDELRTVAPDSVSPQDGVSSTGPMRGQSEDPAARLKQIEHRRQINRKSAQKHRKRRKEEMDTLTQQLAERDHEIAMLKRDLAVEKAKVGQLAELVQNSGIPFGSQSAAW